MAKLSRQRPKPLDAQGASRSSYTAKEWETLQFSYLWAFRAVLGDDMPLTLQPDIGEAPMFKGCPLAREVVTSLQAEMDDVMRRFGREPRQGFQGLGETASLLDQKATAMQAQYFKLAVMALMMEIVNGLKDMLTQPGIDHETSEYLGTKVAKADTALAIVATCLGLYPDTIYINADP